MVIKCEKALAQQESRIRYILSLLCVFIPTFVSSKKILGVVLQVEDDVSSY